MYNIEMDEKHNSKYIEMLMAEIEEQVRKMNTATSFEDRYEIVKIIGVIANSIQYIVLKYSEAVSNVVDAKKGKFH
jgi:hypothetical protein